jgi:hypothetical protein
VTSDGYLLASGIVSAVTTLILGAHTHIAGIRHRVGHTDETAVNLAVAVSLLVCSLGLSISALAALIGDLALSDAGRAVSRAALLLLAIALVGTEWERQR